MDDKCVSCGAYVPEGKMICYNCEQIARTPLSEKKAIAGFKKSWNLDIGGRYEVVEVEEVVNIKGDLHSGGGERLKVKNNGNN